MQKVKVGFIGCGGIAQEHLRSIDKIPETEIVAACDIDKEAVEKVGISHHCPTFTDYHEMIRKIKLDAVIITLPPFAHSDEVQLAAKNHIHIFIEKPIALNMDLAKEMVEAVEKYKVKSQVGFMWRFSPAIGKLKKMIDSDQAGQLGFLIGEYYCNSLHTPWWREKKKSGGQLTEQAIHFVDLARYLFGEVKSVASMMNNVFHREVENYTSEDIGSTIIKFKTGAIASINATNGAIPGQWLAPCRIVTQNITVDFDSLETFPSKAVFHYTKEGLEKTVKSNKDFYLAELVDFIDTIKNDRETKIPIIEGVKALEVTLAANKSARTDRIVKIEEI